MMAADPLAEIKAAARKTATARRDIAHEAMKLRAPLALAALAFPVEQRGAGRVVSGFFPYQSEIDTRPLLGQLAGAGWTTALPIVIRLGEPLDFRRWRPGEATIAGKWNIPRPPETAELVEPDVLLVPLLAFDRQGYRLGYGGGFYDRTLEKLRKVKPVTAIGVAYSAQEVPEVPRGMFDQPLDFVMTEHEVIATAGRRR